MAELVAIDVAVLLPAAVAERAVALSAALPPAESRGLQLGPARLPHVTLVQAFVRSGDRAAVFGRIDDALAGEPPLRVRVPGAERSGETVWMAVERSERMRAIHERLMDALAPFEQTSGGSDAFDGGDARDRDVSWVGGYRAAAAFGAFRPHITLGHAAAAPSVEPMVFEALTVAACHLGRFCTCRRVLRAWTLSGPVAEPRRDTPRRSA